ncbi:Glu-tRNA(Gln) amidotransferase GatDE subunit D [Candidatus Woesearchaeota archaeon CG10_big_fil_rev_8_21_14_0_10_34_8]|nr:MAG: Glu-tRNA(Gln) amidotransferase GatDE subunit D [Candidatus Woesearchaeota archaeon CG10_big_fil_rev_8_21_14_0_10_34_8]
MANTGDKVKVILKDNKEHEGILMPRPEGFDECVSIKLKTGYNIGIKKDTIKKIELVEKYAAPNIKKTKLEQNKDLPNVTVLSTGGTISSKIDYRTGGVYADYTAEDFVQMCPELQTIANIKAKKVMSVMSEDMIPDDWKKLAKEIHKELQTNAAGVVVTMGTDTLHYCTAIMSFMLGKITKPVVFTASQRSIDRGSSDAFMNLICAVKAAAQWDGAEVVTCLHGTTDDEYCFLIRGTKVRKMHTSRRDAFRPMNMPALAKVYVDKPIEIVFNEYNKRHEGRFSLSATFEEKVALITVYPNMDPEIINFYLEKGYKGIVIAATALGHVPTWTKNSLIPFIKKASEKKVAVVICSQTLYGSVHPYVYTNLRKVSLEAQGIFVGDMLPEVAYVKLGWVLSQTKSYDKVKQMMLENIAGEISERSGVDCFLE